MSRIALFPYKIGSQSCKDLQAALKNKTHAKILRVRSDGHYRPSPNDTVINWGNSKHPDWANSKGKSFINFPASVKISVNKKTCLETLFKAGVSVVPFTSIQSEAQKWPTIVERHKLESYGGDGIKIVPGANLGHAPLYTKLLAPASEYRVHVFNGEVIDYTKKYKRVDGEIVARNDEEDDYVKNLENGWEYIRSVAQRDSVKELAIAAIKACQLDFGAVDIIRHKKVNYVLEIGTAAGLSPMGIEAYANAIIKIAK